MIEAAEFAAKWQHEHHLDKVDDSLVKLEPQAVEDINLPADAKRFLIDAGLPRSAAPFLTFDDVAQGLRRIWETWGIPDDGEQTIVSGLVATLSLGQTAQAIQSALML